LHIISDFAYLSVVQVSAFGYISGISLAIIPVAKYSNAGLLEKTLKKENKGISGIYC
jgi:hypothetical protein